MTAGRPTKYREDFCDKVIELGKAGKTQVQIASELDICEDSLYEYMKKFPKFSEAIKKASQFCEAFMLNLMQHNLVDSNINTAGWMIIMRNKFGYHNKQYDQQKDNASIRKLVSVDPIEQIREVIAQYVNKQISLDTAERSIKILAVLLNDEDRKRVEGLLLAVQEINK